MSNTTIFQEEIDMLYEEKWKDFAKEALKLIPDYFCEIHITHDNGEKETMVTHTKKVVGIARKLLEAIDANDMAFDLITVAGLLHDAMKYEEINGELIENRLHPLMVRGKLAGLQGIIGRDDFNDLMLIIESHEGIASPIPQVRPTVDDKVGVWILPLANFLAKQL